MLSARKLAIAPMMDYTDRHDRYLLRLLTKHTWLFTEMVTTKGLIHGNVERHLKYHPAEHPLVLQLGGSDPAELAHCTKLADSYDYDEINLNVGCPSDRVKSGKFGACHRLLTENRHNSNSHYSNNFGSSWLYQL